MLMGKSPYDDASEKNILKMIEKQPLSFEGPRWQCISTETKEVLKSMLQRNPRKRMTVTEILDHPWLNKAYDFVAKNCEKMICTDEAKVEVI
jgi:serine/threonine protein kinase